VKSRACCVQCTFPSCFLWNNVCMHIVTSECFSIVINLKQQKPAMVQVRKASAVLRLSPRFCTVIDVEDYKTIIWNCSSLPHKTTAWLLYGKYKVINNMGVKRGLSL